MENWILGAIFFFMAYAILNILDDIRDELRQLRGKLDEFDNSRSQDGRNRST